jgi:maleate isomerase
LENECRTAFAGSQTPIYATRIASDDEVSTESLAAMKSRLSAAVDLLPKTQRYPVIAYGCTSASAVIGSEAVEAIVQSVREVDLVTNPLRATIAQAQAHGVNRFALLSPYVPEVNVPLRKAFADAGISTEVFGTFAEPVEAKVARISEQSILEAATKLGADSSVDAVFISCTNLRTCSILDQIQSAIGKPVFSSNQSLFWQMRRAISERFPSNT